MSIRSNQVWRHNFDPDQFFCKSEGSVNFGRFFCWGITMYGVACIMSTLDFGKTALFHWGVQL
jgi:hypothetical protein